MKNMIMVKNIGAINQSAFSISLYSKRPLKISNVVIKANSGVEKCKSECPNPKYAVVASPYQKKLTSNMKEAMFLKAFLNVLFKNWTLELI